MIGHGSIKDIAAEVEENHHRQKTVFVEVEEAQLECGIIFAIVDESPLKTFITVGVIEEAHLQPFQLLGGKVDKGKLKTFNFFGKVNTEKGELQVKKGVSSLNPILSAKKGAISPTKSIHTYDHGSFGSG